jgi:DNA transformation protein
MNGKIRNLGPVSTAWMNAVGIMNEEDLAEHGAVEAYKRARAAFPGRVTLNLLWGLQGAILGIPWNELPADMKEKLKAEAGET